MDTLTFPSPKPPFPPKTFPSKLSDTARKKEDDGEIRVFGAEKYFNTQILDESPKNPTISTTKTHTIQPTDPISIQKHPNASRARSESSWSSQRALLNKKKARKARARRFLKCISCKCICSDKTSVDIDEDHVGELSFSKNITKTVIEEAEEAQLQLEEGKIARSSLEVFGERSKSPTMETKPPKLSVEREIGYNYESGSDASSDLFEIDSLTGKASHFHTNGYAPSEASIEWSVATASAADFDEQCGISTKIKPSKAMAQRRRPNLLLSCKSHKAVRVAGDAYIGTDKANADHSPRRRHSSEHMNQVTRFQAGNKMTSFDSKHQLITRSCSPGASHLLFIQ